VPVDGLASVLVTEYHEGTKPAFYVRERDTVKRVRLSFSSSLYVARVSPGARRSNACRSIGFDRKRGTLLYWREGNRI
jgi:hypothetical protein